MGFETAVSIVMSVLIRSTCQWSTGCIRSFGLLDQLRISDIEIAGNTRRNKNNKQKNKPSEPNSVAQSQNVGEYIPHDDGRKSRASW